MAKKKISYAEPGTYDGATVLPLYVPLLDLAYVLMDKAQKSTGVLPAGAAKLYKSLKAGDFTDDPFKGLNPNAAKDHQYAVETLTRTMSSPALDALSAATLISKQNLRDDLVGSWLWITGKGTLTPSSLWQAVVKTKPTTTKLSLQDTVKVTPTGPAPIGEQTPTAQTSAYSANTPQAAPPQTKTPEAKVSPEGDEDDLQGSSVDSMTPLLILGAGAVVALFLLMRRGD